LHNDITSTCSQNLAHLLICKIFTCIYIIYAPGVRNNKICIPYKVIATFELSPTYGLLFFLGVREGDARVLGVFMLDDDPDPAPDIDNAKNRKQSK
jgi:hypothetical protein